MLNNTEIIQAAALLRAGGLVAFPTETVYGLGADAANETAVRNIFQVKGRPYDHPLIVHLAAMDQLKDWARDVSPSAMSLAQAFWPGPLTMVLKKQPYVLDLVTGGQPTVGVRIPSHPDALALLKEFHGGVVAPSANKFTHISPTTAQAVREELSGKIDMILDGGACQVGLESTIIDMSGDQPVILRPGMISAKAIEAVLGVPVLTRRQDTPTIRVPGMHHLHYAPTTKTVLVESSTLPHFLNSLSDDDLPVVVMTHSVMTLPASDQLKQVTMPNQASAYAHDLYHTLRLLDHQDYKQIVIESVPLSAEWEAIRDRLYKATAER